MTLVELIITIGAVLSIGVLYTYLWFSLNKEVNARCKADLEQCPSLEEEESEE